MDHIRRCCYGALITGMPLCTVSCQPSTTPNVVVLSDTSRSPEVSETFDRNTKRENKPVGSSREIEALRILCNSDDPQSADAVMQLIPRLSPIESITFCRELEPKSYKWIMAIDTLASHPKSSVISYFAELAASPAPIIRCFVYKLCIKRDWDDYLLQAQYDQDNQTTIILVNQADDEKTLGQIAVKYIRMCHPHANE
jgi:hypothetical protein